MSEKKEVEKYKLTKETAGWLKELKKRKQAVDFVKSNMAQQMAGIAKSKELLGTLQQGLVRTLQMAPEEKVNEIEGQEMTQ